MVPPARCLLLVLLLCAAWAVEARDASRAACPIEDSAIAVTGGTVHVSRAGSGPSVLLVHGLFAQKEQWHALMCLLAESGYATVAPDLPGFGVSTGFPVSDYRLERQVDRLHETMQALGLRRLHVAGNSMGGAIAALYAGSHGDEVASLAFIGAPLGVVGWGPRVREAIFTGTNPFIPLDAAAFDLEMQLLFVSPPALPPTAVDALVRGYVDRYRHYQQVWDIVNLYDDAVIRGPRLDVPALVVWGRQDAIFPVEGLPRLSARLRRAEAVSLDGAGHLPMVEKAQATRDLYVRFLARHPSPSPAKSRHPRASQPSP